MSHVAARASMLVRVAAVTLALALALVGGLGALGPSRPALADSVTYSGLGYPWPSAPCATSGSVGNTTGKCPGYTWGLSPCPPGDSYCTSKWLLNGYYLMDQRGYVFRNCTSYVAWKLTTLGVPAAKVEGLGNGGDWADNAYQNGLTWSTTPKAGTAAVVQSTSSNYYGHVAYVEAYDPSTDIITVSEYNYDMTGDGDVWTGHPASRGFSKYVDFGVSPSPLGMSANPIAVGTNADGRLEVFGANADQPQSQSNIYHAWQLSPGGSWSQWYSIAGYLTSVAVARNADGRLELFGVNTDQPQGQNNIYHAWQLSPGGAWSQWYSIPGYLTSIAAATNADGRIEIWGVNADQPQSQSNIYHAWQLTPGGYWSSWSGVAGYLTAVALNTNADGRLEVWGVNADQPQSQNNIYHAWQLTPGGYWSSWSGVAGYLTGISEARNGDGRLEVFGVNTDQPQSQSNIYHAWQLTPGGYWSSWAGMAGYLG